MRTEVLNKKVFRLVSRGEHNFTLDKSKVYTIVKVKDFEESKDFCQHYILQANNETIEIREYECVFIPDETLPEIDMVNKFLADNLCYPDEVYHCDEKVCVQLDWSDWKHGHIWCETLMKYLGYEQFGEIVTEENGSDCYSATHYFYKISA